MFPQQTAPPAQPQAAVVLPLTLFLERKEPPPEYFLWLVHLLPHATQLLQVVKQKSKKQKRIAQLKVVQMDPFLIACQLQKSPSFLLLSVLLLSPWQHLLHQLQDFSRSRTCSRSFRYHLGTWSWNYAPALHQKCHLVVGFIFLLIVNISFKYTNFTII